jgi:hypothetical protein
MVGRYPCWTCGLGRGDGDAGGAAQWARPLDAGNGYWPAMSVARPAESAAHDDGFRRRMRTPEGARTTWARLHPQTAVSDARPDPDVAHERPGGIGHCHPCCRCRAGSSGAVELIRTAAAAAVNPWHPHVPSLPSDTTELAHAAGWFDDRRAVDRARARAARRHRPRPTVHGRRPHIAGAPAGPDGLAEGRRVSDEPLAPGLPGLPWIVDRRVPADSVVPPAGFEPAHPPPEGGALSPELRGLVSVGLGRSYQPARCPPAAPVRERAGACRRAG